MSSAGRITALRAYVDNHDEFTFFTNNGPDTTQNNTIDVNFNLANGTHTVVVVAWNQFGTAFVSPTSKVTVTSQPHAWLSAANTRALAVRIAASLAMPSLVTPPLSGAYSVTKHAVVALSEALVQDLALRRAPIGVSVLCPGWVATGLLQSASDPALRSLAAHGISPEAVAERTVRAVRSGEFYVLTHPELAPAVRRRADDILAGRAPGALPLKRRRSPAASR